MPKAPCKKQTETKSTSPKFRIEKYAEILKYKNPISKSNKNSKKGKWGNQLQPTRPAAS